MFVQALQSKNNTRVAYAGEGNENLKALLWADLSICVRGLDTSEVMLQNSDVILPGSNLYMLKYLIEQSHRMSKGLRKYLQFKITSNFSIMLIMFFGACFFAEIMLAPIQIMWICIFISEFAERALIAEISDPLANTKPSHPNSALISKAMWKNIILWTFMIVLVYELVYGMSAKEFGMAFLDEDFGHYVSETWV